MSDCESGLRLPGSKRRPGGPPRLLGELILPACTRHPCGGTTLIFFASFQFERMLPEGNPFPGELIFCPAGAHGRPAHSFDAGWLAGRAIRTSR